MKAIGDNEMLRIARWANGFRLQTRRLSRLNGSRPADYDSELACRLRAIPSFFIRK